MNIEITNPSKTILAICLGLQILFFLIDWNWLIAASSVFGIIGIFSSYLSKIIHIVWMKFGEILSKIISPLVLGVIYYGVLFPISTLAKFFRQEDPLLLKEKGTSTFIKIDKEFSRDSFHKTW